MNKGKKEGLIDYRAHWKLKNKCKYCIHMSFIYINKYAFLTSLGIAVALFIYGTSIVDEYWKNSFISIAAGFFVYFCTCSCVSMRNRYKLRKELKKKHEIFKYNMISHFLDCAHIPQNPKMVESLLEPEKFWHFFLETADHKSNLDRVMNGLHEKNNFKDLKEMLICFFDDVAMSLMGAAAPTEIVCRMLDWKRKYLLLQRCSVFSEDVKYIVYDLFCWFADWSNIDEGPYSFEHLIDEI